MLAGATPHLIRDPAAVKVTGACQRQPIRGMFCLRGRLPAHATSGLPQGRVRYRDPWLEAPLFCQAITSTNVAQVV